MSSYDLDKARQDLDQAKDALYKHLLESYYQQQDSRKMADETFKFLHKVVDQIIKRQKFNIAFNGGGSPTWHSAVLSHLSNWIEAELRLNMVMAEELNKIIEN